MGRKGRKDRLNDTEAKFVEAYTRPNSKTTLNATASYQEAFNASYETANAAGCRVTQRPQVQRAMKEMLADTDIADKVRKGLYKIADGFNDDSPKYRAKEFLEMARLVTEIRGDKAPDKQVVLNITPEQRDAEYEEIANRVMKIQTTKPKEATEDAVPDPEPEKV